MGIRLLVLAQVTVSQFCGFEPHIGLRTVSLDSLSPSLSASTPLALSLSQNKYIHFKREREAGGDYEGLGEGELGSYCLCLR